MYPAQECRSDPVKWEYLEIYLDYTEGRWQDSLERDGELVQMRYWYHSGRLLNDLGRQGWELVAVEAYPRLSAGNSMGSGQYTAKWILKRPSSEGTGA
jgi:hypothetical protein